MLRGEFLATILITTVVAQILATVLVTILVTVLVTVLITDVSAMSMVMSMVMTMVANLQCNYLLKTKICGQKWREISMGGNSAQERVIWNGQSIPFYPSGAKWNENLFHFAPEGFSECRIL